MPVAALLIWDKLNIKSDTIDEVVVLLRVLPGNLNQGYQDIIARVIKKVNGHDIRSLRDMIGIVETSKEPFVVFENESGLKTVLDRERCRTEQPEILKTYQVVRDRSPDLLPMAQKAK